MDQERRIGNQDLLMDLLERTAKIEARGEARDAWQAATTAEIKQVRQEVSGIRADLSALLTEINAAKAVARAGGSVAGWLLRLLPVGAVGAVGASLGWLAALFQGPR